MRLNSVNIPKETLNKSKTAIASAAKQSRKSQRLHSYGLPRRFAPRDDILIQRYPKYLPFFG